MKKKINSRSLAQKDVARRISYTTWEYVNERKEGKEYWADTLNRLLGLPPTIGGNKNGLISGARKPESERKKWEKKEKIQDTKRNTVFTWMQPE